MFYKERPTFELFTLLYHVYCIYEWLIWFYAVFLWFYSLVMVPCESKHVGMFSVIL